MLSAFAFSSAQRTLPCKVCLPRMASTWMAVPLTPSVVKRASLGFVLIQTRPAWPPEPGRPTQHDHSEHTVLYPICSVHDFFSFASRRLRPGEHARVGRG